jgi:hypothetical protein
LNTVQLTAFLGVSCGSRAFASRSIIAVYERISPSFAFLRGGMLSALHDHISLTTLATRRAWCICLGSTGSRFSHLSHARSAGGRNSVHFLRWQQTEWSKDLAELRGLLAIYGASGEGGLWKSIDTGIDRLQRIKHKLRRVYDCIVVLARECVGIDTNLTNSDHDKVLLLNVVTLKPC